MKQKRHGKNLTKKGVRGFHGLNVGESSPNQMRPKSLLDIADWLTSEEITIEDCIRYGESDLRERLLGGGEAKSFDVADLSVQLADALGAFANKLLEDRALRQGIEYIKTEWGQRVLEREIQKEHGCSPEDAVKQGKIRFLLCSRDVERVEDYIGQAHISLICGNRKLERLTEAYAPPCPFVEMEPSDFPSYSLALALSRGYTEGEVTDDSIRYTQYKGDLIKSIQARTPRENNASPFLNVGRMPNASRHPITFGINSRGFFIDGGASLSCAVNNQDMIRICRMVLASYLHACHLEPDPDARIEQVRKLATFRGNPTPLVTAYCHRHILFAEDNELLISYIESLGIPTRLDLKPKIQ